MRTLLLLSTLVLPAFVQAHPGHGASTGNDWIHYLTSSGHTAPAALILTIFVLALMLRSKQVKQQPTQNNR